MDRLDIMKYFQITLRKVEAGSIHFVLIRKHMKRTPIQAKQVRILIETNQSGCATKCKLCTVSVTKPLVKAM